MKIKDKKIYNIIRIIWRILYDILIVFCMLIILIIFMQRISESNRSLYGYRIFRVISGSMQPEYDIGDVVISKETDISEINIGDSIVYKGQSGELNGKIIMHEVVDIYRNENNEIRIKAKGIQNTVDDPDISANQIYGVVKIKSKILTVMYKLAINNYSSVIIILILVVNVFISFKWKKEEITKDDDKEEKIKKENKEETGTEEK